jgi:hypothetical protein
MDEALQQIRASLRSASEALSRYQQIARSPKERDHDLDEARRAHRHAVSILETLQSRAREDHGLVEALAPLQVEIADLDVLLAEIRFDDEHTERLPRLWQAEG